MGGLAWPGVSLALDRERSVRVWSSLIMQQLTPNMTWGGNGGLLSISLARDMAWKYGGSGQWSSS